MVNKKNHYEIQKEEKNENDDEDQKKSIEKLKN
jgi:hypothetical protein